MKKIISIAVVVLLFFLVGAIGMYLSVPRIFPEKVPAADSLATDSLALELEADSIAARLLMSDSLGVAMADSMLGINTDSTSGLARALPRIIASLRDSLALVRNQRDLLAIERDSARSQISALEQTLASAIIPDGDAAALSKTLASMDEKEMRPILARISDNALAALYHTASARDKRTLMAAMPPDRAVHLVQRQLAANESASPAPPAAVDSTAIQ